MQDFPQLAVVLHLLVFLHGLADKRTPIGINGLDSQSVAVREAHRVYSQSKEFCDVGNPRREGCCCFGRNRCFLTQVFAHLPFHVGYERQIFRVFLHNTGFNIQPLLIGVELVYEGEFCGFRVFRPDNSLYNLVRRYGLPYRDFLAFPL